MSAFPKTRAAARYAARHARSELARARAAALLTRLGAREDIPAGGDVPAVFHGVLRDLVLAARDLAARPGSPPPATIPTSPRSPPCRPPRSRLPRPNSTRSSPGCCGPASPRPDPPVTTATPGQRPAPRPGTI